jgi:hypothetical protein
MHDDAIKDLDKEVRRLKRIAAEWAGQLHDLVEERLPAAYEELPALSASTLDACRLWAQAQQRLEAAQRAASVAQP